MGERIEVLVVFAASARAVEMVPVTLERDARVETAIAASRLMSGNAALTGEVQYGIWGKLVSAQTLLRGGERIEIYRPLKVDPKTARRRRALKRAGLQAEGQPAG